MKRVGKAVVAGLLSAVMMVSMVACAGKFDAAKYVQSCMDLLTKGETEDYVEMTGRTEEQAQDDYESNIESMVSMMDGFGLSDATLDGYRQLYKDLYAKSKYEVKGAEKMDGEDGYVVTVEIQQMTGVFNGLTDELMTAFQEQATEDMTDDELNELIYSLMLEKLQERLDSIEYKDAQTIEVEVVGENNVYSITDEGYTLIDNALLDTED